MERRPIVCVIHTVAVRVGARRGIEAERSLLDVSPGVSVSVPVDVGENPLVCSRRRNRRWLVCARGSAVHDAGRMACLGVIDSCRRPGPGAVSDASTLMYRIDHGPSGTGLGPACAQPGRAAQKKKMWRTQHIGGNDHKVSTGHSRLGQGDRRIVSHVPAGMHPFLVERCTRRYQRTAAKSLFDPRLRGEALAGAERSEACERGDPQIFELTERATLRPPDPAAASSTPPGLRAMPRPTMPRSCPAGRGTIRGEACPGTATSRLPARVSTVESRPSSIPIITGNRQAHFHHRSAIPAAAAKIKVPDQPVQVVGVDAEQPRRGGVILVGPSNARRMSSRFVPSTVSW